MTSIDSDVVLLSCAQTTRSRWLPFHGSRRVPDVEGVPRIELPARPDRVELDPVLDRVDPRRVVVSGTDADLAAVLVRLLRTERLHVEIAYLPPGPTPATRAWGLPHGRAAAALAVTGTAAPVPLVRDDAGGVLVGRGEVDGLTGECYCDETLVLRGTGPRLVVVPGRDGIAVRAGRRAPDGRTRPVPPMAAAGRGSALGRAVQVGGESFAVTVDGVAHPRRVQRWTWFRHTTDLLLVRH